MSLNNLLAYKVWMCIAITRSHGETFYEVIRLVKFTMLTSPTDKTTNTIAFLKVRTFDCKKS